MTRRSPDRDPRAESASSKARRTVRVVGESGRFEVLEGWQDRLFEGDRFLPDTRVAERVTLKDTAKHLLLRVTLKDGERLLTKIYRTRGVSRLVSAVSPRAGAVGEWVNSVGCWESGVPCPEPIAVGRLAGQLGSTAVVMRYLEGAVDLVEAVDTGRVAGGQRHRVTRALGRLVASLHDAGWFPFDAKLSNFMMSEDGEELRLWAIDLKKLRRRSPVADEERKRNLQTLFNSVESRATRTDRYRFLRTYLEGKDPVVVRSWSRELERRGCEHVVRVSWDRSRLSYMVKRDRLDVVRRGSLTWHRRPGECDAAVESILDDPAGAVPAAEPTVHADPWVARRLPARADARRLLRMSAYLEYAGIGAPRVVAAGEPRRPGAAGPGYLVFRETSGIPFATAIGEADAARRRMLLEWMGRFAARLHDRHLSFAGVGLDSLQSDHHAGLLLTGMDALHPPGNEPPPQRELGVWLALLNRTAELTGDDRRAVVLSYAIARRSETVDREELERQALGESFIAPDDPAR